jgi:uncharacterized protein (DUF608 family)
MVYGWHQLLVLAVVVWIVTFVPPYFIISEGHGAAISLKFRTGKSNPRQTIKMAVSWDNPEVKFMTSAQVHKRRYSAWFKDASSIAAHALNNLERWEEKIEAWQGPVLSDE